MTHVLDNPVWHALSGRQAGLAIGAPPARRYAPDISPWAALQDDSPAAIEALAPMVPEGEYVIAVRKSDLPFASTAHLTAAPFEGVQMVAESVSAPAHDEAIVELGDPQAAEMLELATLTKPGPFIARTHVLGGFVGIRKEGRLVAMAGERFKLDGFTEVSGVCTHPDYRGRGYAGLLSRIVAARIQKRGEVPILHAYVTNTKAIRLYEQLGFAIRTTLQGAVFRRA